MNSFDNFRQTSSPDISVTVKTETAKKISLFSAITIVIGAIVGSGVFFKNIGVSVANAFAGTFKSVLNSAFTLVENLIKSSPEKRDYAITIHHFLFSMKSRNLIITKV